MLNQTSKGNQSQPLKPLEPLPTKGDAKASEKKLEMQEDAPEAPETQEAPAKPTSYVAEGFDVPEGCEKTAIAEIEQPSFDPMTGKKLSTPRNVTFNGPAEWEQFNATDKAGHYVNRQGWVLNKILHLPLGFRTIEEGR